MARQLNIINSMVRTRWPLSAN